MFAWQIMLALQRKREAEARRYAGEFASLRDGREQALRGAIVGAPADPEAFG